MAKGNVATGMAGAGNVMGGGNQQQPQSNMQSNAGLGGQQAGVLPAQNMDFSKVTPNSNINAGIQRGYNDSKAAQGNTGFGGGGTPMGDWGNMKMPDMSGNTGINGGRMDGGRLAVMPRQQYTPQDRINTMNRIQELNQYDPRYPTPIAGRNMNDPRNGEMDVLTQRMNEMGNRGGGGNMIRPDVMPRMRFDTNMGMPGGGGMMPQEQGALARRAQGGGGMFNMMPGMGGPPGMGGGQSDMVNNGWGTMVPRAQQEAFYRSGGMT